MYPMLQAAQYTCIDKHHKQSIHSNPLTVNMDRRPGPDDATSSRRPLGRTQYVPSAPKVSQIDAGELDEGLVHMLGERLERAVANFRVCLPFPHAKR